MRPIQIIRAATCEYAKASAGDLSKAAGGRAASFVHADDGGGSRENAFGRSRTVKARRALPRGVDKSRGGGRGRGFSGSLA